MKTVEFSLIGMLLGVVISHLSFAAQKSSVPDIVRQHVPSEFCFVLDISSMRLADGEELEKTSIPVCVNLLQTYRRDLISCSGQICTFYPTPESGALRFQVSTSRSTFFVRAEPIEAKAFLREDGSAHFHFEFILQTPWSMRLLELLQAHRNELPFIANESDLLIDSASSARLRHINLGLMISEDSHQNRISEVSWFNSVPGVVRDQSGQETDFLIRPRFLEMKYHK